MKAIDCSIGTRVGWITTWGQVFKGRVISPVTQILTAEVVVVECDNGHFQKIECILLFSEDETLKEEAKITSNKARLEEEFKIVAAKVKVKVDAAAALIFEAQGIASTVNKEVRYMKDVAGNLQDALDSSGWYRSSSDC